MNPRIRNAARVTLATAILATAASVPVIASAHAFLKAASPAVGSTVNASPREVAITYTEGVEPLFSTIAVTAASGARVDAGKPHLDGGDARLAVALKPLTPGTYRVTWHVTATDTHRTQGSFAFTVR